MAVYISEKRVQLVLRVATELCHSFNPGPIVEQRERMLKVLHPNVKWYDHGFYIVRTGHDAIAALQKGFLHCNQPFVAEIKKLYPTEDGAIMEQIWRGVCENDIVRPSGELVMKGSGRQFTTHVSFFFKISSEGLITRIDEYDYRHWDEGRPEEEYSAIGKSSQS